MTTLPEQACTVCGAPAAYVENSVIYGQSYGDWPYAWLCQNTACNASVGVHPGTDTPLGTFADRATRQARRAAHAAFDPLWRSGRISRNEAYKWLAAQTGISQEACHIGRFDKAQCERVIEIAMMSNKEVEDDT